VKRKIILFGLLWAIHFLGAGAAVAQGENADNRYCVKTVVIDAGHGGKDPGAVSGTIREKDIALRIALKTGAYIEKYLPEVKVCYTRTDDRFVELHKRAKIANEAQADLFISIHCNANKSSKPFGTETYVMGLHKSQANLEVAKKENAAILLEEDYESEYEGYDPNLPENTIIFSLFQNAFLNQSLTMASLVEDQFRERVHRHDRGVKQAGFLVLYRTTMPGILVETGFLTNPSERAFLAGEEGQTFIASAIYRAFKNYKEVQEKLNNRVSNAADLPITDALIIPEKSTPEILFTVQFLSSKTEKPLYSNEFTGIPDLGMYQHQGLFKYTTGEFTTFEEASEHRKTIITKGFSDAFIVAFHFGDRISIEEARKMTANKSKP